MGLRFAFQIGVSGTIWLKSALANIGSTIEHPTVVSGYLPRELGPSDKTAPLPLLHVNSIEVIPNSHKLRKMEAHQRPLFRRGHSFNDGTDPTLRSLTYSTINKVANLVASLAVVPCS